MRRFDAVWNRRAPGGRPTGVLLLALLAALGACRGERAGQQTEEEFATASPGEVRATAPGGMTAAPAAPGAAGEHTIDAELSEWAIRLSETSAPAGRVGFRIRNTGTMRHEFKIEGPGVEEEVYVEPGGSATLAVELRPGTYEITCELETEGVEHDDRGMRTRLTVRG